MNSDRVRRAIDYGATPLAAGLASVHELTFQPRSNRGTYRVIVLHAGDRTVEITVSPTGRSVHVYVDGRIR